MITPNAPRLELRAAGRTWHAVAGREWSIGRASEADIRLDNPRVSRQHAIAGSPPEGWVLVNLSTNGTFVDGQRVERLTVRQPILIFPWFGVFRAGANCTRLPSHPPTPACTRQPRHGRQRPNRLNGGVRRRSLTTDRIPCHWPVGRHDRPHPRTPWSSTTCWSPASCIERTGNRWAQRQCQSPTEPTSTATASAVHPGRRRTD
ncbi:FHA domain-containing protein [Mycobacterium tuberculosis]